MPETTPEITGIFANVYDDRDDETLWQEACRYRTMLKTLATICFSEYPENPQDKLWQIQGAVFGGHEGTEKAKAEFEFRKANGLD